MFPRAILLFTLGIQFFHLTAAQTECSDALKTTVEDLVKDLLGLLADNNNGIVNSCDDSIKQNIDCQNHVQVKLTELNNVMDITGFCLLYAMEYFDETRQNPQEVDYNLACSFSDLNDACPNLELNYAVNGSYGTWSEWSDCVSFIRNRSRACDNPSPAYDGYDCSNLGSAFETEPCGEPPSSTVSTVSDGSTNIASTAQSQSRGTTLHMSGISHIWLTTLVSLLTWLDYKYTTA